MRAIGMVEFNSIAKGIYAADQMAKISEVEFAAATSTCPGKYIAIVHGDVAAVEDSVRIGERMAGEFFIDSIIIPNVDPGVFPAITGATMPERVQAVGIMESFSLATMMRSSKLLSSNRSNCVSAMASAEKATSPTPAMWQLFRLAPMPGWRSRRKKDSSLMPKSFRRHRSF